MSTSSILGGQRAARQAPGKDVDLLGPSDSSDSGSDVQGERAMSTQGDEPDELGALPVRGASDSDSFGTGERGSATGRDGPDDADIMPTRIEQLGASDDALDLAESLDDRPIQGELEALGLDDDDEDDEQQAADAQEAEAPSEHRPRRERRGPRRA